MPDISGAVAAAAGNSQGSGTTGSGSPAPATAAPSPASPVSSPAPSTGSGSSSLGSTGVSGSTGSGNAGGSDGLGSKPEAGSQGTAQATPAQWQSIRDAARAYGYNLEATDDHAALQQLILQARRAEQLQQMAQYGNMYLQHAGQFEQWQRERQEQTQRQQQQQANWFQAPEWNPAWRSMIQRDPQTGEVKTLPGYPPDTAQKYLAAVQHQQAFLEKFSHDPIGAIKPGIEQMAQEIANQIVQQHLGGYRDQSYAQNFLQEHKGWLYQADQNGNQIRDPQTNKPMLSQWGLAFRGYLDQAGKLGIQTETDRANYALQLLRTDWLLYQQRQQQQQGAGDAGKQQFLQQAQQAAAAQIPPPVQQPAINGQQQPQRRQAKVALSDRIKARFAQNGITDQTLKAAVPAR